MQLQLSHMAKLFVTIAERLATAEALRHINHEPQNHCWIWRTCCFKKGTAKTALPDLSAALMHQDVTGPAPPFDSNEGNPTDQATLVASRLHRLLHGLTKNDRVLAGRQVTPAALGRRFPPTMTAGDTSQSYSTSGGV